jgi:hypothetical protein
MCGRRAAGCVLVVVPASTLLVVSLDGMTRALVVCEVPVVRGEPGAEM